LCWYGWMSEQRVFSARREIAAPAAVIFELIADPARQPEWDGNDNLGHAPDGQRVRGVGDVFTMTLNHGAVRENHVVQFDEGRLIAWRPSGQGGTPPGHLWRWELEPLDAGRTLDIKVLDHVIVAAAGHASLRATARGELEFG